MRPAGTTAALTTRIVRYRCSVAPCAGRQRDLLGGVGVAETCSGVVAVADDSFTEIIRRRSTSTTRRAQRRRRRNRAGAQIVGLRCGFECRAGNAPTNPHLVRSEYCT